MNMKMDLGQVVKKIMAGALQMIPGRGLSYINYSFILFPGFCLLFSSFSICPCPQPAAANRFHIHTIQAAVESVGEEISQYAYVSYLYKSGKGETLDVSGTNEREGSQLLEKVTAAYAVESVKRKISEQWVRDLSFYGTQITEDEMLQIIMKYKMPLPFSFLPSARTVRAGA